MRASLLLLAILLAGCAAPAAEPAREPTGAPAGESLLAYDAAGLPLAPPPEAGIARLFPTGHRGPEPGVALTSGGVVFVTAWDALLRSRDAGVTWEVVRHFVPQDDGVGLRPGGLVRVEDPMLWVDPATDRVFWDPMFPALLCTHLSWSDDEGASWFERPAKCHPPPFDHQKLVGGPPGPKAPPVAGKAYPSVLYECYHAVFGQACGVSYDGGLTWGVHALAAGPGGSHETSSLDGCAQNGRPAVSAEGIVAIPLSKGCPRPSVALSEDSGLTWVVRQAPWEGVGGQDDQGIAFDAQGRLYLLYSDADNVATLARTSDLGLTWEGPWRVAPPGVGTTAFTALAAGAAGRVGMVFLGTAEAAGAPEAASKDAVWDLWVVTSEDADAPAPTFLARRPASDPVQVGPVCNEGVGCLGASRNLGDFLEAHVDPDGLLHFAFADGCIEACAREPAMASSNGSEAVYGRLDGWRLAPPQG